MLRYNSYIELHHLGAPQCPMSVLEHTSHSHRKQLLEMAFPVHIDATLDILYYPFFGI